MKGLLWLCVLAVCESAKLVKVVILARHGNRAPNLQIPYLCPVYAEKVLPHFDTPLAQLSKVGIAENWESGKFLRKRYMPDFLPKTFVPDGSVTFFAERMTRNVVSTEVLAKGMYPDGTGEDGFLKSRPNIVPISTSQEGKDELMNCPRDGPCRHRFREDFNLWAAEHDRMVYAGNVDLFDRISRVCGNEWVLNPMGIYYQGRLKTLTWGVKAISDAFSFAANEGLDATMDGALSIEDLAAFKAVASSMVNGTRFGHPHQLTYWVSNFLPNLFQIGTKPNETAKLDLWRAEKFHLFLNHRELIYSIAHILGLKIAFPGMPPDVLPAGCFLGFEMYEMHDGSIALKFYWWGPTRPNGDLKVHTLKKKGSLLGLYKGGDMIPVAPHGCDLDEYCPLKHIEHLFTSWTAQTGTYHHLCKLPEFHSFRKSTQWHDPSDPPAPTHRPVPVAPYLFAQSAAVDTDGSPLLAQSAAVVSPSLLAQSVTVDRPSLILIPVVFCLFAVLARLFLFHQEKMARPL